MESEGSYTVEIAVKDNKGQLTAVLAGLMIGDFLPPQLVHQEKTLRCLPHMKFPAVWAVTYSANHWSNEQQ